MSTPEKAAAAPDQARLLRDVLGLFPTGVAVITALTGDGERLGATVSSFNSVSLTPPLILFSMARNAKSFPAWEVAEHFGVNILSESQSRISTQFARPMSDKWEGLDPVAGRITGAPLIRDALAWLECKTWARYPGGDHLIIVGEVLGFERLSSAQGRPLVFSASRYARLAQENEIPTPPQEGYLVHGW
ncbi:MAG: flavin reductase family protein [Beijerinckiaceae bacterium]|nr:flavin reductase family protein [Beijerinckiaceae bacterium]